MTLSIAWNLFSSIGIRQKEVPLEYKDQAFLDISLSEMRDLALEWEININGKSKNVGVLG